MKTQTALFTLLTGVLVLTACQPSFHRRKYTRGIYLAPRPDRKGMPEHEREAMTFENKKNASSLASTEKEATQPLSLIAIHEDTPLQVQEPTQASHINEDKPREVAPLPRSQTETLHRTHIQWDRSTIANHSTAEEPKSDDQEKRIRKLKDRNILLIVLMVLFGLILFPALAAIMLSRVFQPYLLIPAVIGAAGFITSAIHLHKVTRELKTNTKDQEQPTDNPTEKEKKKTSRQEKVEHVMEGLNEEERARVKKLNNRKLASIVVFFLSVLAAIGGAIVFLAFSYTIGTILMSVFGALALAMLIFSIVNIGSMTKLIPDRYQRMLLFPGRNVVWLFCTFFTGYGALIALIILAIQLKMAKNMAEKPQRNQDR